MSASDPVLILLPPSETKRAGGTGAPLDVARLALPQLSPERDRVIDALTALSADAATAARILRLGVSQHDEVAVNALLRSAPTMPAVDRYTGVLFDALEAATLDAYARRWLARHVLVHSAPLGPVGALDGIPAYRLGAGVSLPGIPALRRVWAEAVTSAIAEAAPSFVLDMRSEAYVALGPVPTQVSSSYVRVVTDAPDGGVRALNHFNKHAKGALLRRLALERPAVRSRAALLRWAGGAGVALRETPDRGILELVVTLP